MENVTILGCRLDVVGWSEIINFCRQALSGSSAKQIITLNGEFVLDAQRDQEFKDVINKAELVIADSTNVAWAARFRGANINPTPGIDLVWRLAELAAQEAISLYLLGAKPGVAKAASEALVKKYPQLKIAGYSNADPDDREAAAKIKHSGADVVLVAYGAPTQDRWIAKHKAATGAKLLVGVGGSFDMIAGQLPRAPRWLRVLHLEWLWRLVLQPSRWKRIWRAVVIFPLNSLLDV